MTRGSSMGTMEGLPGVAAHAPLEVGRDLTLVEKAVFVGGQGGCGKTMITPIIGSLARVELQRFDNVVEMMCGLYYLGKIDLPTARTMIRMATDTDLYNLMMSRETNFRPSDLSSVFKNPGTWRYIRRLFQVGNAKAVERMAVERPILHVLIHDLLVKCAYPILETMGQKAVLVEVVRHPLYMLKQGLVNVQQFYMGKLNHPREFLVWFRGNDGLLPWFALGMEERYATSNPMDKAIYIMEHHIRGSERAYEKLSIEHKRQVLIIPFEQFVLNPAPQMRRIEAALETRATGATEREMKRQCIPRKRIADGISLPIYKQYGWKPAQKGASERDELNERRQFAAAQASPEAMRILDQLSAEYEEMYAKGIF